MPSHEHGDLSTWDDSRFVTHIEKDHGYDVQSWEDPLNLHAWLHANHRFGGCSTLKH